jgi:hypothetical protein
VQNSTGVNVEDSRIRHAFRMLWMIHLHFRVAGGRRPATPIGVGFADLNTNFKSASEGICRCKGSNQSAKEEILSQPCSIRTNPPMPSVLQIACEAARPHVNVRRAALEEEAITSGLLCRES